MTTPVLCAGLALFLAAPPPVAPTKLLVLPLSHTGEAAPLAWVGEVVADGLPRHLQNLGIPVVSRVERLRAHDVLEIPAVSLTRATSVRLAEALGVSRIISGRYELKDRVLALSLRTLDVERGTLSPPHIVSASVETLPVTLRGLAWDMALAGPSKPAGSREAFLAQARPIPFPAFEAYAMGLAASKSTTRMDQLRKALRLKADYDEARLELARLQIETRDHASAETTLSAVKDDSPLARAARFLQGVALLELARYDEAAKLYERLASEDPSPGVLSNHALTLLRAKVGGASALLRRAVDRAPGWVDLAFNLGWALLLEGDTEAAIFWLRGVTRQAPRDLYARVALSWALSKAGRQEEAAEEWRGVALMGPSYEALETPDLSKHLGRVLSWEEPLVIERSDVQLAASHVGRADALLKANDTDGALRELTRAAYLDPYSARAHELMARAHLVRGDKEKAVNELQMSLWCREDSAVRLELSRALLDLGRRAESRAEAEKVLKSDPGNAEAASLVEMSAPPPAPK